MIQGRGAPQTGPSRERGRATKHRILEATMRLCIKQHQTDASVAQIAREAEVFPNQVTYHFGSKDSLLVQAAFLGLLHDARRVERVGRRSRDPEAFRRNIARTVLAMPSLPAVTRALASAIAQPDLADLVDSRLQVLFRQSERFLAQTLQAHDWRTTRPVAVEVRTFWSAALGAVLLVRAGTHGDSTELDLAGTLTVQKALTP
ncbi:TetR/AcrR family transcriptional regulator C-terminal domain-containing protein [Kineococcus arenarius]|uniref:TetR/AcrR family transcriptional regulator C-terminal domain-containing protein n=1 Tax=unclassified Kineococcus TaxID=2621656 RepID=UPI003D7E0BEF